MKDAFGPDDPRRADMRPFLVLAAAFGTALVISSSRAEDFHGVPCSGGDCDTIESGYHWAQEREIVAEADCQRTPHPFYSGCVAWAREYRSGLNRARQNDLRDASECDGTDAEILGCQDYVEE